MPSIDFRDVPLSSDGFSKLFADYIYDFPRVKHFYNSDFHSLDSIPELVESSRKRADHREALAEILLEQNKLFGCSEKTFGNIDLLRRENTFCVVTGQQVGILGGPLYTVYKIFSALKLVAALNEKFPQFKFIPVFWLEGEDHDFEEANHITLLDHDNNPARLEYLVDGKPLDRNVGAVGELTFDVQIDRLLERVAQTLPGTEFRTSLLETVRRAYSSGQTFNQSFVRWVVQLLTNAASAHEMDTGLVFVSANEKRIKRMLSPIFMKELNEFPRTSRQIIDQSAILEKEYHAQIKPRAINLFLFHKGGRYLIEPRENDFSLKGTRHFPTRDELLSIAEQTPELLSPNVVLRTICQDSLLPTVVYVAGPSEIAYFAQLKPVYEYYGVAMPMIYPRASATIVEQKIHSMLEKYQLDVVDLFGNPEKLRTRVVEQLSEVNLDELTAQGASRVHEALSEMRFGLTHIDPTLSGVLETTQSKIDSQFHILHEKAKAAQRRKHDIVLKQIEKGFHNIYPNGNFQERELNILHFMNKYGSDFPRWLFQRLDLDPLGHQVIEL